MYSEVKCRALEKRVHLRSLCLLTENPDIGRIKFQKVLVGLVPAADALVGSGALGLCCAESTLLPVLEATVFVTLHKRGSLFPLTFYKLEGGAQSTSELGLTKS